MNVCIDQCEKKQLTKIELKLYKAQYDYVYTHYFIMIGLCNKCYTSGVKVMLTEVAKNEIGITEIPLCDRCRD